MLAVHYPILGECLTSDILCVPFEQWGAALIYFTGKHRSLQATRLCQWGDDTADKQETT